MSDDLQAVNPRARLFRIILSVYGIGIYIFLFAPIAVLVLLSFNSSSGGRVPDGGLHDGLVCQAVARHRHSRCAGKIIDRRLLGDGARDAHRYRGSLSAGSCQHQKSRRGAGFHHTADHDAGSAHRRGHLGAGDECTAHPALVAGSDHRADRAGDTVRHPGGVIPAGGVGPQSSSAPLPTWVPARCSDSYSWCCH